MKNLKYVKKFNESLKNSNDSDIIKIIKDKLNNRLQELNDEVPTAIDRESIQWEEGLKLGKGFMIDEIIDFLDDLNK